MKQKKKVSNINQSYRGIVNGALDLTPLEELLVKKDQKGLEHYLAVWKKDIKNEISYAQEQEYSLQKVNTGFND